MKHKFSLLELIVVLVGVGVFLVLVIPDVSRKNEQLKNKYEYIVEIRNPSNIFTYYCDRLDQNDKFYILTDNQDQTIAKIGIRPEDRLIMIRNSNKKGK